MASLVCVLCGPLLSSSPFVVRDPVLLRCVQTDCVVACPQLLRRVERDRVEARDPSVLRRPTIDVVVGIVHDVQPEVQVAELPRTVRVPRERPAVARVAHVEGRLRRQLRIRLEHIGAAAADLRSAPLAAAHRRRIVRAPRGDGEHVVVLLERPHERAIPAGLGDEVVRLHRDEVVGRRRVLHQPRLAARLPQRNIALPDAQVVRQIRGKVVPLDHLERLVTRLVKHDQQLERRPRVAQEQRQASVQRAGRVVRAQKNARAHGRRGPRLEDERRRGLGSAHAPCVAGLERAARAERERRGLHRPRLLLV